MEAEARLPSPETLRARLAAADREALRQAAEAEVVRWVWATGPLFPLRPGFDDQIHGWARSRVVAEGEGAYELGLDAQDRLVVCRLRSDGRVTPTYVRHADGGADEWSFLSQGEPAGLAVHLREGGRVVAYRYQGADDRRQTEVFTYDDAGRLRILRRAYGEAVATYTHDYDDAGRLARILLVAPNGRSGVVWERPSRTRAALVRAVKEQLVALVPARVASLGLGPIARVALIYDPVSTLSMLPPKLAVSTEARWDAMEWPSFDDPRLELDDPALLADARELAAAPQAGDALEEAHGLLVSVAKALKKAPWAAPRAKGFVVFPADLHGEHLERDLAAVGARRT